MPLDVGIYEVLVGEEELEEPTEDLESIDQNSGMGLIIYKELHRRLSPPLQEAVEKAEGEEAKSMASNALKEAKIGWWALSYAIAKGVIDHITSNMEIKGIRTIQQVHVQGDTETAMPSAHKHSIAIAAQEEDLVFETFDYPPGEGHVA